MAQSTYDSTSNSTEQSKQYQFSFRDTICELLYLDSDTSDVNFLFPNKDDVKSEVCEKTIIESIPAHKIFLKKGSKVFCEMFNGSWKEKKEVEIVDVTPEAFKEFLQCFYLGSGSFTKENIDQVMYLADKYMIDDILTICSNFLINTMTLDDFCSSYALSIMYKQTELRKFCEQKIKINAMAVFDSADFLDCKQFTLTEVLNLDLVCDEIKVFDSCMNWAKNACKKKGVDDENIENLRVQLGDCLHLIRFVNMTLEQFCQCTSKYDGLLGRNELQDALNCFGLKGHESKIFVQKPRLCWNESNKWNCFRSLKTGIIRDLQKTESVQITSNKTTLLGGVYGWFLHGCHSEDISTNASIEIIEKSSASETVLFSGTMRFNNRRGTYVKLKTPIIIKEGVKYEIQLKFSEYIGRQFMKLNSGGEIKSPKGLQIKFDNKEAGDPPFAISGLELMDW